ncbi:16570_t:CDS:2, partial [Gigaspora rosea]
MLILEMLEEKDMLDIHKATNPKKRIATWIETGMHMRKNTFAKLWRKDKETLSIDSDKATEEDWNAYKGRLEKEVAKIKNDCINIDIDEIWERILNCIRRVAGETLPKKKRAPELQELQVEDGNLRMLKKNIRRIAKWCSKIKRFKFQETEDSELDLFILEEEAKGLLENLRSKHSEAHIEEET